MFFRKKNHFIMGMLIGVTAGAAAVSGTILATDSKRRTEIKKMYNSVFKKASGFINSLI